MIKNTHMHKIGDTQILMNDEDERSGSMWCVGARGEGIEVPTRVRATTFVMGGKQQENVKQEEEQQKNNNSARKLQTKTIKTQSKTHHWDIA